MSTRSDWPRHGVSQDTISAEDTEGLEVKNVTITEVRSFSDGNAGWEVTTDDYHSFGVTFPDFSDMEPPQVGDRMRVWLVQWSIITGIALRGRVIRFKTYDEHYAEVKARTREKEIAEEEAWKSGGKEEFTERLQALPIDFQRRIQKYMVANPEWGWRFGRYEMFVCEQAVKMALGAKEIVDEDGTLLGQARMFWEQKIAEGAAEEVPPTDALAVLTWWRALGSAEFGYDTERMDELIGYARNEHSANTFRAAFQLAVIWLRPGPAAESGGPGVFRLCGAFARVAGSDVLGDPVDEAEMQARWREVVGEDGPELPVAEESWT